MFMNKTKKPEFTFLDRTITTDFQLGEDQVKLLEDLIVFIKNKNGFNNIRSVSGAPGTGKTTIICYLQKYFKYEYSFIYLAPTHTASAELAVSTVKVGNKHLPSTIASSLVYNDKLKKWFFSAKIKQRILFAPVFIIDESSMLDSDDIFKLESALEDTKGCIIFLGDIKQIPKVSRIQSKTKYASEVFIKYQQLVLNKVFRQSENNLLNILTKNREQTEFKLFKCDNTDSVKFVNNFEFNKELRQDLLNNLENTIVISYSNNSVKNFNNMIRSFIGYEDSPKVGEIIMGYIGYSSKQIEKGDICNSISYKIDELTKELSVYKIRGTSSKLNNLKKLGISGIHKENYTYYYQMDYSDSLCFDDLNIIDYKRNNEFVSELFREIHEANENLKNKQIKYVEYSRIITNISTTLRKVSVGNNYVYNPKSDKMELYDRDKHSKLKLNGYGSLLFEKDIDYGYSITCHKSQGLTIDNVYFCAESLKHAPDIKIIDKNDVQVTTEQQALATVAMSRARKKLVVDEGSLYFEKVITND